MLHRHAENLVVRFASVTSHPMAAVVATLFLLAWAYVIITASIDGNWQVVFTGIPSGIAFIMVFVLRSAQFRYDRAMHLKLDRILIMLGERSGEVLEAEHKSHDEITDIQQDVIDDKVPGGAVGAAERS